MDIALLLTIPVIIVAGLMLLKLKHSPELTADTNLLIKLLSKIQS
jgi:hypothetical protein